MRAHMAVWIAAVLQLRQAICVIQEVRATGKGSTRVPRGNFLRFFERCLKTALPWMKS